MTVLRILASPRRRFLIGGTVLAAAALVRGPAVAQERPTRKITVYKSPT